MASLLEDLPIESIPTSLGGNFDLFNEPFDFNFAKDGPLYYDASTSDLAGIY